MCSGIKGEVMSKYMKDRHSESGAGRVSRRAQARRHSRVLKRYINLLALLVCVFIVSVCALIETIMTQIRKPIGPGDWTLYDVRLLFHSFLDWLRGHEISNTAIRLVITSVAIVSFGMCWVVFRLLQRGGDSNNPSKEATRL